MGSPLLTAVLWFGLAGGATAKSTAVTAPPNDNFADAVVLSGDDAVRTGDTNVGAMLEAGEPTTVAGAPAGASVWYQWTAPASGQAKVDTATSDYDTLLAIYTGNAVGTLAEIASNDDTDGVLTSAVSFAITSGTTYRIRVDGYDGATGTINLHLHRVVPPANDDFANAIALGGVSASRTGDTNEGAALEAGEPTTVAGVAAGASVWYAWTPADSGQLTIDTATSDFDTLLAVYTGNTVGTLSAIASNDNGKDGFTSLVSAAITGGTTYRIRVDGANGLTGTINLHLRETLAGPPPANDDFANAAVLSGLTASRTGDANANATLEAGEPPSVAGAPGAASVWYQWTAPIRGTVTVDTATSNFDTLLAVYTGSTVGGLSTVASNDDAGGGLTSSVTFVATASTVYSIRVDGFSGDAGTINLHLVEVPPPPNDDFVNAIVLSGRSASRTGDTNVGGTLEAGEPDTVAGETGGTSVWYRWTSPVAGSARVDTITSNFDTLLGIYTGSAVDALTAVAADDQSGGSDTSAVTFDVTAGTTYEIRVDGYFGDTGLINLHLVTTPDAPTGLTTTPGAGQVSLNWTTPAVDGGSAISGYQVTAYTGNTLLGFVDVGATTQVTIGGLTNGTTYTFRVAARNAAGLGPPTAPSSPVTPRTFPSAPSNPIAAAGPGSAKLTWTAPTFDGGSPITGYVVRRFVGGVFVGSTTVGLVTQATIGGLTPGTTYTFRVLAVNVVGGGLQSAESNPVTPFKVVRCVVPNVKRKTLARAKRLIAAAHCRTGRVTKAKSKTVPKGRVIAQFPKAGKRLVSGSKVRLVVSRGKR